MLRLLLTEFWQSWCNMAGVYSVTQVNAYIKNMFAQDFALNRISIKGEVSNCKYHTSGHIYFTLKRDRAERVAVIGVAQREEPGAGLFAADHAEMLASARPRPPSRRRRRRRRA